MKPSKEFRKQLADFGDAEFITIPKKDFAECIGSLDSMEQVNIALHSQNKGVDAEIMELRTRVSNLEVEGYKACAERDAVVELFKQIFMEVLNAKVRDSKDQQTKDKGPPVQLSK